MTHVNHDMFTNKDGFPNGGVEVEVSKPTETQSRKSSRSEKQCYAEKQSNS